MASRPASEVERSLPAKLNDDTHWLLPVHHVEHVLQRKRFEVQPVSGIVIGRDRFRVAVEHDCLETHFGKRKSCLAAAVVKLDALANAVGTAAQDKDLGPVGGTGFVIHLISRVEVRSLRFELGCTGIHPLKGGQDIERFTERPNGEC